MNQVKLQGTTTRQETARQTKGGRVMNMRLKCSSEEDTKDGPRTFTSYVDVVVWGTEFPAELPEGAEVYVEGRIGTRKWEQKDGSTKWITEVTARQAKVIHTPSQQPMREPGGDDDGMSW